MKQLFALLLALGFVVSAAAIPAHAQAMQETDSAVENESNSTAPETEVERGPVENSEKPVRRGPPAFVQDLMPEQALQNVPSFFW